MGDDKEVGAKKSNYSTATLWNREQKRVGFS